MRLVALMVAAVGVLGTGCVVENTCAPGQVTLNWAFYDSQLEANTTTPPPLTCGAAGVSSIRVFVNGVQEVDGAGAPTEFPCSSYPNGVVLDGFGDASNEVIVEGLDTSGAVVLYRSIDTLASTCGVNNVYAVSPARGSVNIDYVYASDYPGFIWYELLDNSFDPPTTYFLFDVDHDPGYWETSLTGAGIISVDVPLGSYTLAWIENAYPISGGYFVYDQNCVGGAADVISTGETTIQVDMHATVGGEAICY